MSMREPTKETRTLDLRGTSTHGSEMAFAGGKNGYGTSPDGSEASSRDRRHDSGDGDGGREAAEDDDDDDDDGFAAEKRAAVARLHSRQSGTGIREGDEDEGIVTDDSPTTMVGDSSSQSGSGSGRSLQRRVNGGRRSLRSDDGDDVVDERRGTRGY